MISAGDLGSTTLIAMDALCEVSKELGLEKNDWSSYQTALTRDTMTMMNLDMELQDLDELSWTITKRKVTTEQELASMKNLLENMRHQRENKEKGMVQQWKQETMKLKEETRIQESYYENEMENTRSKIDDATVTNLRLLENQTVELEKQLDQMKKQLEQYYDLPHDMELANIKLQEKKSMVTSLKKRREQLLDDIANSMY